MPERDWSEALTPFRQAWEVLQGASSRASGAQEQGFWSQLEQLSTLPPAATQQAFASVRDWQVELGQQAASRVEQAQRQAGEFAQSLLQEARRAGVAAATGKAVRSVEQAAARSARSMLHGAEQVATHAIGTAGRAVEGVIDAADAGFHRVGQLGYGALTAAGKAVADSGVGQPIAHAARGAWGVLEDIDALVSELWHPADESEPKAQGASASSQAKGKAGEPLARSGAQRGSTPAGVQHAPTPSAQGNALLGQLGELVSELWPLGGGTSPEKEAAPAPAPRQMPLPAEQAPEQNAREPLAPVLTPSFTGRQLASVAGDRGQQASRQAPAGNPQGAAGARAAPGTGAEISEEEWLERLNRALIEQAWMRGVDLT